MVCAPVRSIIPSLKLGDYLSVQAHKPCSISHLFSETEVLIRLPDGFTCISMKRSAKKQHEPQCGPHEAALTNEKGLRLCVSLDSASTACGEGYKAVKLDSQFVCRKERINLRCQEGFVLSFDGETPACVSETGLNIFHCCGALHSGCIYSDKA